MFPKIERTKDGTIKDFSVPDAHTLYIKVFFTGELMAHQKPVQEAVTIPSLDFLDQLHLYKDPDDGLPVAKKWALTPEIIKELKENGSARHDIPGYPMRFEYWIRKTLHADNLKHRG
jgi:hypothetical protein